jgi:curved DNA-binding protein CbpA
MSKGTQSYYEILGVPPTASEAEIRRAYARLVRQYHPDNNPGDPKAVEMTILINEAWEVLRDPVRRSAYDEAFRRSQRASTQVYDPVPSLEELLRYAAASSHHNPPRESANRRTLAIIALLVIGACVFWPKDREPASSPSVDTSTTPSWDSDTTSVGASHFPESYDTTAEAEDSSAAEGTYGGSETAYTTPSEGLEDDSSEDSSIGSFAFETLDGQTSSTEADQAEAPANPVRLANGARILADQRPFGLGKLTIVNSSDQDAAIKLVQVGTTAAYRYYYVRSGAEYTIGRISPGTYQVFVRTGVDWDRSARRFRFNEELYTFMQPNSLFEFTEEEDTDGTWYTTYSVTLHAVTGGNLLRRSLSEEEFGDDLSGTR